MIFHYIPWICLPFRRIPLSLAWYSMIFMIFGCIPWCSIDIPWCSTIFYEIQWDSMLFHHLLSIFHESLPCCSMTSNCTRSMRIACSFHARVVEDPSMMFLRCACLCIFVRHSLGGPRVSKVCGGPWSSCPTRACSLYTLLGIKQSSAPPELGGSCFFGGQECS